MLSHEISGGATYDVGYGVFRDACNQSVIIVKKIEINFPIVYEQRTDRLCMFHSIVTYI